MTDIFNSDFTLPPSVYILAPGWNGTEHYKDIPADAYVIALNKAVLIPAAYRVKWKISAWLVFDCNAPLQDWWEYALFVAQYKTIIFGQRVKGESTYTFRHDPICAIPYPGSLCAGSTVLGTALQLCYWFMKEWCPDCLMTCMQQKHVYLVGCDQGTRDFTGEVQYKPGHFKYAAEGIKKWEGFLAEKGISVNRISPLEVQSE